jgi:integrase
MPIERLTDRRVKTVRAEGKPLEVRDALVRGLELRVMLSGSKSWALRYRRKTDGRKRTISLGGYPAVTLNRARSLAREKHVEIEKGKDPAGDAWTHRTAPTFDNVASDWLAWKRQQGRSISYLKRSEERLAKNVFPIIGDMKACDVTKRHVSAVIERVAMRHVNYESNRVWALLRAILRWASGTGRIENNPSADIPRPFEEKARKRVLSDVEIKNVWKGIERGLGDEASKIAMKICLVLGQRPKEIVRLAKNDLCLDAPLPTMTIIENEAKNADEHIVPLSGLAQELFREVLNLSPDNPWVFPAPNGNGPMTPHALTQIVSRTRRAGDGTLFGAKDARLYDFKRTVATGLGDLGFPDEMIGRLLNHRGAKSKSVTSKHYNHAIYVRERLEMLLAWETKLRVVLSPQRSDPSDLCSTRDGHRLAIDRRTASETRAFGGTLRLSCGPSGSEA